MPSKKHIHRYQRAFLDKDKKYPVYKCNLPNCTHYLAKALVRGKEALCNRCGKLMIMGPLQLTLAKPHCNDCVKPKEEKKLAALRQIVEAMDASSQVQSEGE